MAIEPIDAHARHEWLPDGRTSLVFRVVDGGRRGDVSVAGPRTRACVKDVSGVARAVIVKLEPGWSVPLLGVAASEVTDRIVPLDEVWGRAGSELYQRLVETLGLAELLDCLAGVFAHRMERSFEPSTAQLARRAARHLENGEDRVERLAARFGVTARHLRRAFTEHIGVGPKSYARSVRLQRALKMATRSSDWARIAAQAGYCDQAHLITDFRKLVGVTPRSFATRARQADLCCN